MTAPIVRLFDSSHPGNNVLEPFLDFDLPVGTYKVMTTDYEDTSVGKAIVHHVAAV